MIPQNDPAKNNMEWWRTSKQRVRSILRSYPAVESIVLKNWRSIRYIYWRAKWRLEKSIGKQRSINERLIDIDRTYWVNPHQILYSSLRGFRFRDYKGQIIGGDWDRLECRFDSTDLYQAIEQVCIEGTDWHETGFYQRIVADLVQGKSHYSCHNEKEFFDHCKNVEYLFAVIKQNGYKSQQDIYSSGQQVDPLVAEDEITVCIGRYGDLLFSDGAHRLAIAKILNLPRVPIKVAVRHRDWITFRDELLQYYNHSQGSMVEKVIQPVTHIDFLDVPFSEDFEASFRIIADNTSVKTGRLLDLASGFGYFCHRFEEYGFDCVAVENDPQAANILKRLARAGNRKFMIIDQSLVENTYLFDRHFNIVLAIDIIPHLKTEHTFKRLIDFFRTLHMDELFLGVPLRELTHLQGINQGLSPAELVSIILGNSSLNTAKIIGTTIGNKPLFKLYSQAH